MPSFVPPLPPLKVGRYGLSASRRWPKGRCGRIIGELTLRRHENANVIVSLWDITLRNSGSRGNNFRPDRKREVRGLVKVISYYFDAATCAFAAPWDPSPLSSLLPLNAFLYKDTRVSKLLDYNELPRNM